MGRLEDAKQQLRVNCHEILYGTSSGSTLGVIERGREDVGLMKGDGREFFF